MELRYLIALIALLGLWLFIKRRAKLAETKAKKQPERRISKGDTQYHAVSIRFGRRICASVRELEGQRILASEAPRLPLPDCDIVDCECSFVHYKDRRAGKDRRSPFTSGGISAATGKFEHERRDGGERRKDRDLY